MKEAAETHEDIALTFELEKELVGEIKVPIYRTIHANGINGTYQVADPTRREEAFDLVFKKLVECRKRERALLRELGRI